MRLRRYDGRTLMPSILQAAAGLEILRRVQSMWIGVIEVMIIREEQRYILQEEG